jgi:hypothetical protein
MNNRSHVIAWCMFHYGISRKELTQAQEIAPTGGRDRMVWRHQSFVTLQPNSWLCCRDSTSTEPSMVPRSLRASLLAAFLNIDNPIGGLTRQPTFRVRARCRDDLVHDKAISVCVDHLWRSGLPGLSAGCQGFYRHGRHREHELRSLAVYERASIGGDRLDSRFLDGT